MTSFSSGSQTRLKDAFMRVQEFPVKPYRELISCSVRFSYAFCPLYLYVVALHSWSLMTAAFHLTKSSINNLPMVVIFKAVPCFRFVHICTLLILSQVLKTFLKNFLGQSFELPNKATALYIGALYFSQGENKSC